MNYILARLNEPSTYAGIAAIAATVSGSTSGATSAFAGALAAAAGAVAAFMKDTHPTPPAAQ